MPGFRQVPAVALSDGKSKVKLIVQLKSSGKFAPNFALKRAKLISLKIEGDAWVVEVLPDGKVCDVAVIVLNNSNTTEIPLTVAQDASGSKDLPGKLGENELSRILNVMGTGKARGYDLNGDGKQDYIDDYILTANYIAGQRKSNEMTVQNVLNTKSI
jgi:hypothetical protein